MNVALALAALLEGSYAGFMAALAGASPSAVPRRMSLASYLTEERRFPLWQQKLFMDHAIVDVGMKAASGDGGPLQPLDLTGGVFSFAGDEHGHLRFEGACPLEIGAQVRFIPSHCDTTVNLYDQYVVVDGEEVVDVWDIAARGRVQ